MTGDYNTDDKGRGLYKGKVIGKVSNLQSTAEDYREWEFVILEDPSIICQKKLNQWRHNYELAIVNMAVTDNTTYILLARRLIQS